MAYLQDGSDDWGGGVPACNCSSCLTSAASGVCRASAIKSGLGSPQDKSIWLDRRGFDRGYMLNNVEPQADPGYWGHCGKVWNQATILVCPSCMKILGEAW